MNRQEKKDFIRKHKEKEFRNFLKLKHDGREWNKEKKKTRFISHEKMFIPAIEFLQSECLSDGEVQYVLEMINLHYVLNDGAKPEKYMKRFTNRQGLFDDVMKLVEADHKGRIFGEGGEGKVEIPFGETVPKRDRISLRDMNRPICEMLIGVPNSGKSSFIKSGTEVLSRDDELMKQLPSGMSYNEGWHYVNQKSVDEEFNKRFTYLKRNQQSFIVDRTNLSRKSRRRILSQLPKEYLKVAKVFLTGFEEIFRRNSLREGKELPTQVILDMMKTFELPDYSEFDEIKYIFN